MENGLKDWFDKEPRNVRVLTKEDKTYIEWDYMQVGKLVDIGSEQRQVVNLTKTPYDMLLPVVKLFEKFSKLDAEEARQDKKVDSLRTAEVS